MFKTLFFFLKDRQFQKESSLNSNGWIYWQDYKLENEIDQLLKIHLSGGEPKDQTRDPSCVG